MLQLRRSEDRGVADHGWLKSRHTFSFGSYYHPHHMGVSSLRVINDDYVVPGGGFPTHPHQDMEILSYVLSGSLEHKDSMGNVRTMKSGEFQLMSAGTGVTHSEYNPNSHAELRFLQIWIQPNQLGVEPGYQQASFPNQSGLTLIAGPETAATKDAAEFFHIHQDAYIYRLQAESGETTRVSGSNGRPQYLHVISGTLRVGDTQLNPGDALTVTEQTIELLADTASEALLFDLPPAVN